ncbi:MAG: alanine racemase [Ilumatobacter sp.]|nr:MAG: alanine racemase [Ilumatobacter sp.]
MSGRWAWAEVDLGAITHNVGVLRQAAAPAEVWAVVKADGYGHGAVAVAGAALAAGATGLCVALVQEGVELRRAGFGAPILVLSEQPHAQLGELLAAGLTPTVYSVATVERLVDAGARDVAVHVKVDTGMQRVGAPPDAAHEVVDAVLAAAPALRLAGVSTHLAVADDPDDPMSARQLADFDGWLAALAPRLAAAGLDRDRLTVHTANSAGALAHPGARRSVVRAGIAMYGISPGPGVDRLASGLRPAMRLVARVSFVKPVAAGSRISYGLRHTFERATTVATVPLGYADGVPRRLSTTGGEVLVGGRRCPIVGVVTMDQLMVDVGDAPVAIGDEVVLLGRQTGPDGAVDEIRAEEWADRLDTIGYEIVCGISGRVERLTG